MSQRRRYEPDWPDYRKKRRLHGRGLAAAVALVITALLGSRFAPSFRDTTTSGSPTPAAQATSRGSTPGGSTPASARGALALVERDGSWVSTEPLDRRPDATSVRVRSVIDGDTIDVLAAQTPLRVRFYGVDTPERDEACYAEATRRTTELTRDGVILVPDQRQQDPGGRELRYVFTPDGRSIDATLVVEGLAKAWRDDGTLRSRLVALEDSARRSQTGCLWNR